MGKWIPNFIKIAEGKKVALIDPISKVCLGVSERIADNLENKEIQEKIYSIWEQQARFIRLHEEAHKNINSVYLMVTRKCNMNCEFCAMNANGTMQLDEEFRLDDIEERVIPFLKKCKPHKLIITGGEPLIRESIVDIAGMLRQGVACPIILQSNGLAINTSLIKRLSASISEMDFSTKHMFETKNKEKELVEHICLCQENDIKVVLSFIYEKTNLKDLYKLIDIAAEYDVEVIFNVVSPVGKAKEKSNILSELELIDMNLKIAEYILLKGYENKKMSGFFFQGIHVRNSCGGYGHIMAIFPEGDVYMCQCIENDEVRMGNIKFDDFNKIMCGLQRLLQLEEIKKKFCVDNKEICKLCSYRYLCGGNCAAIDNTSHNRCFFQKALINFMLFHYKPQESNRYNLEEYVRYFTDKYLHYNMR